MQTKFQATFPGKMQKNSSNYSHICECAVLCLPLHHNESPDMIANNLSPFEPTHPGELIRDELESLGMTQTALAAQIGVRPSLMSEVINGKRAVNTEMALLLEAALGVPADVWLRLQADYNMQVTRANKTFMNRLARIRKIAAVL